jgi:hypothetical protein
MTDLTTLSWLAASGVRLSGSFLAITNLQPGDLVRLFYLLDFPKLVYTFQPQREVLFGNYSVSRPIPSVVMWGKNC